MKANEAKRLGESETEKTRSDWLLAELDKSILKELAEERTSIGRGRG